MARLILLNSLELSRLLQKSQVICFFSLYGSSSFPSSSSFRDWRRRACGIGLRFQRWSNRLHWPIKNKPIAARDSVDTTPSLACNFSYFANPVSPEAFRRAPVLATERGPIGLAGGTVLTFPKFAEEDRVRNIRAAWHGVQSRSRRHGVVRLPRSASLLKRPE